jgi:RNA polymerase sigma factor (sigma-70 family)
MNPVRRKTIHEAMVRFADGDRSAIEVLMAELWPVLLDFARRGLASDQDAEDVAQEVFVRICSRITEFDRARDGLSWAFGIAGYEVMSQRRRQRRRREVTDLPLEPYPDPGDSGEAALAQRQLLAALEQALGALTDDDRLMLGSVGGAAAGVPAATHRKRKQRALERLRDVWRGLYGRP